MISCKVAEKWDGARFKKRFYKCLIEHRANRAGDVEMLGKCLGGDCSVPPAFGGCLIGRRCA